MNFSNWLGLWTVIMPLAVILYYFFRKKYTDQRVSTVMFWEETMKEIQASPYFKKLQHHLLFYLQLAALFLCVVALMGPFLKSETLVGNEFIFVVNTSATMLAGSPSQFELQRENMMKLAEKAGGKPVTIMTTGANPQLLIREEEDTDKLVKAIAQLEVEYENEEMPKALLFAESLARDESTVIHVFTDSLDRKLLAGKTGFAYVVHGQDRPILNAAIRQFGLAESDDGLRAMVQIANTGSEKVEGDVIVSSTEGSEKRQPIELDAGAEIIIPFEGLTNSKLWSAELQVDDGYKVDNKISTYVQQTVDQVYVDASLQELVSNGFESLDMETIAVESTVIGQQSKALIVTNQTTLLDHPSPILLFGRNDESAVEVSGTIETSPHELFAYAPLDKVYVSQLYPAFKGFETIASIDGQPFIQVSPRGDIVVLTDIEMTDWPLSPSFPLFLWSAALRLSENVGFLGVFEPNEHRAISLVSAGGEWEIFQSGSYSHSYHEGQGAFKAPSKPGVYDIVGDEESKKLIVRLSNEEKTLTAGKSYAMGEAANKETTVRYSVVSWIVFAILLLLIAEWEVYRRGIITR